MAFAVNCPECGSSMEVEDEHREWTVRCPHCRHEFRPGGAPQAMALVPDDDEPERPRKRRPRRDFDEDEDDENDFRSAARDVASPAIALKCIGWLGVVFSLLGLGIWILLVAMVVNQPPAQRNANPGAQDRDEVLAQAAIYIPQSCVAFAVSIVILIGAGKMSRLESYGWAQTAAIIGMVPCISPCCLLGLPFGIWALQILNKPHVMAAFRNGSRRTTRYHDEDDE